ncbi:uncharacterized protein (TIGR02302 family) [Roseospira visakhapatnamensis]|uniref:Uncharacterized protein (TIGR02302 family) n=1 Tax=Roseospira visakhapatnamensis TaxID=390880 RepID=A0A7W6W9K9_9PROT|nr:uncharacterized protein (TIGR02302 family) [Roseospira visakhapatnamensis]
MIRPQTTARGPATGDGSGATAETPGAALPRRPVRLSALALLVEDLARRLWPALTWAALTLAALLSGLLPLLPGWLHLLVLTVLLSLTAATLTVGLRGWRPPSETQARARLEASDGAEAHRPWTAAADSLAFGADDALARALWTRHQEAMAARARALRPAPPQPVLARHDPRAFRVLALILLAVAAVVAGPDPWARILRGLSPHLGTPPPPVLAQVWITPPDYTGQPPLYLQARPDDPARGGDTADAGAADRPAPAREADAGLPPHSPEPLTVPAGSAVLAVLRGGRGTGRLDLGAEPTPLDVLGDGGQRLTVTVDSGTRLRLIQAGRPLIDRPLRVRPDQPPTVTLVEPPAADAQGALRMLYRAEDDHGVAAVRALVRPAGGQRLGVPLDLELPAPPPATDGSVAAREPQRARRDLRAHPWAGTSVAVRLRAEDARGQTARTKAVTLVLPDRRFTHPVAQAVADLRRALVLAPHRARAVAQGLNDLADDPSAYDERLPVFLALKAAAARLTLAPHGQARDEDLPPLWSIALALEDGSLALARRALAEAREALREAIERDAPADDIQRRLDAVREAMARLQETLAETLPFASLPVLPPLPENGAMLRPDDISRMLDDLAALNDLGAKEAAEALLDQIDQMLDQLQGARPPTAAELRAMTEMAEMARRLRDVVERQQALLDETFALDPAAADGPRPEVVPPLSRVLEDLPLHGRRLLAPPPSGVAPDVTLPFDLGPDGDGRPPSTGDLRRWLEPAPPADASPAVEGTPPAPPAEVRIPAEVLADLEGRQQALRQMLEDLMADLAERTSDMPPALNEANLAMRDAEGALAEGDIGAAARAQGRALEALRQGGDQAMAGMARRMGLRTLGVGGLPGLPGPGLGRGRGPGQGRDPLDRPVGGVSDDGVGRLPTEPDTRRARDILLELRRRANQPDRPPPERNYLDRLIAPF